VATGRTQKSAVPSGLREYCSDDSARYNTVQTATDSHRWTRIVWIRKAGTLLPVFWFFFPFKGSASAKSA